MNLKLFPLDTQVAENPWLDVKMGANDENCRFNFYFSSFQTCHLTIASYGWTASDLIYLWKVKTLTKHITTFTKKNYFPLPISSKGWKSFSLFFFIFLLRDVTRKKRENVGFFPKSGPPPPLFENDMFVRRKKLRFILHFRTLGTFIVGGSPMLKTVKNGSGIPTFSRFFLFFLGGGVP